jgi:ABC-type transporter Mla MlaB component
MQLDADLTVAAAHRQRDRLIEWLGTLPPTGGDDPMACLDASGVSEIDTAGVQLLLAAAAEARARGRRLEVSQPSEAMRAVLATYGLGSMLEHAGGAGR